MDNTLVSKMLKSEYKTKYKLRLFFLWKSKYKLYSKPYKKLNSKDY